jgi:hypothetical protein
LFDEVGDKRVRVGRAHYDFAGSNCVLRALEGFGTDCRDRFYGAQIGVARCEDAAQVSTGGPLKSVFESTACVVPVSTVAKPPFS